MSKNLIHPILLLEYLLLSSNPNLEYILSGMGEIPIQGDGLKGKISFTFITEISIISFTVL